MITIKTKVHKYLKIQEIIQVNKIFIEKKKLHRLLCKQREYTEGLSFTYKYVCTHISIFVECGDMRYIQSVAVF